MMFNKDIFISYKNDNAGNNFARRLKDDLEKCGYSVYFNSDETGNGDFPERLRSAIQTCKDFILIVSQRCLDQLLAHNKVDWIREEVLTAFISGKKITPVMLSGVEMPSDADDFPEDIRFLHKIDHLQLPEEYQRSPFEELIKKFISKPEKDDIYRDIYNCNESYSIVDDFKETKEKAESGDFNAMYELANMYFYGMTDEHGGSNRDFSKAYFWFKKISEASNELSYLADSMIAKMHYRGIVPREQQSYEKALQYHKKAASQSGYSAQQLAFMLSIGIGCDYNFDAAAECYREVINAGDSIAYDGLAKLYMRVGKYKEAAELYQNVCHTFPEAEYQLGLLYKSGVLSDPPRPDYYRAAFHFQHVISLGVCKAAVYYELGVLYFSPTGGFIKDFKCAQDNFSIAADLGHADAQYMLGYMYEHGHIERNIEKAIHYHKLAAEQGHVLSPTHLAILYQMDECKNYHQAFKYAQMAANLGEKEGEFVLGNLLYLGRGCAPDVDRAYEMYAKASTHGIDQASFMMSKIKKYRS